MTDSLERNLDALAHRIADAHRAADATLADEPVTTPPSTSANGLSYEDITEFHDRLRDERGWSVIDLESVLGDEERGALDRWRARSRVRWSTRDFAMVAVAGLVGAASVWFNGAIDGAVTKQFDELAKSKRVRAWEAAGKRLPIDYMGKGFGGRAHRIKSGGHDLARLFSTLRQVLDNEFVGVRWEYGERIPVHDDSGRFREVDDLPDAALRVMKHLAADFLTPMSLPVPGTSWLYESHDERTKNFAHHAYSGLRAGQGWNLRSATIGPGMTTLVIEVLIRTHAASEAYRETGTIAGLSPGRTRKRTEMLLAAHALVGALSTGKAVAQLFAIERDKGKFHPAAIRHVQFPSLLRAGVLAAGLLDDAIRADRYEASTWDDLVVTTTVAHQLAFGLTESIPTAPRPSGTQPQTG